MFVDEVRLMTSKTQLVHALSLRRWCAAILAVGVTIAMVLLLAGGLGGTPTAGAATTSIDQCTASRTSAGRRCPVT